MTLDVPNQFLYLLESHSHNFSNGPCLICTAQGIRSNIFVAFFCSYKALRITNPLTRKKIRRRKCRKRHRRRCSGRRRKRPDFSRVKLVLKVTKTPVEKRYVANLYLLNQTFAGKVYRVQPF